MGEVIKEIISPSGKHKAIIRKRDDGNFEVEYFKFTHEIVPGYGEVCEPFWEPIAGKSLVDSLYNAEKVAIDELPNT